MKSVNFTKNAAKLSAVLLMLLFTSSLMAQHVGVELAKTIAKNFYTESFASVKSVNNLDAATTAIINERETPVFYVFNMNKGGFVLVAADQKVRPVLGYAAEGVFDINNMPCCVHWLTDQFKTQIYEVINDENTSNYVISNDWAKFSNTSFTKSTQESLAVTPLLTTTWSQGCYYNAMCPADSSLGTTRCGRVPTGCVATAFSQVMKYHNFPLQGTGSKSYAHSKYGTLSANFAATTYNWASMPNKLTSDNQAAATLLYHAGVAIAMDYGPNGSSAYTTDVRKALVNNFKYASTTTYKYKTSYTDPQWVSLIKAELDAQRVVLISGYDPTAKAGHAFIADGYQNTDYFHINWGWNGSADGYFYLNALNPSSYAFNSNVGAIIGIKPSSTPTTCSGQQTLTAASGTVTDGSGSNDYANNLDCKWLIKPTGAGTVTLTFSAFNTETNYDFVKVYDGETTSATLLGSFSGTAMPQQLTATSGKMLIHFTSDGSTVKAGWSANYTSAAVTNFCSGTTTLTAATGTVTDGSGSKNYSDNSNCYWVINPPGATSVKLTFSSFNTESNNDKIFIYDGTTTSDPLLGSYSGTSKPPALTATSGKMLIRFVTNATVTKAGWSAKWVSQASFCSGTTTLTSNTGTISDGSGNNNYNNHANCKWLIKPTGAGSVKLTFTAFDTESGYDFVKVYNGETTSSPLLGSFSGSTIPAAVTATSGKMLVVFTSDNTQVKQGFAATYQKMSKDETGIEENLAANNIEVAPNPSNGDIVIHFGSVANVTQISIVDVLGKIIYKADMSSYYGQQEWPVKLDVGHGIYYLVVETHEGRITKKLMINN